MCQLQHLPPLVQIRNHLKRFRNLTATISRKYLPDLSVNPPHFRIVNRLLIDLLQLTLQLLLPSLLSHILLPQSQYVQDVDFLLVRGLLEFLLWRYQLDVLLLCLLLLFSFQWNFTLFENQFCLTLLLYHFTNMCHSFVGLLLFCQQTTFCLCSRCHLAWFCYSHSFGSGTTMKSYYNNLSISFYLNNTYSFTCYFDNIFYIQTMVILKFYFDNILLENPFFVVHKNKFIKVIEIPLNRYFKGIITW